ncbi:transcriptional regulator Kaiso-like [Sylvia atricapilla]|uniref:transcriptional regulator Kaiso-like n=1 Tax=Sylvia atricapilla TaxID=48155 RepID=UPI003390BDF9
MEGKKILSAPQYPRVLLQSLNEQRGCGLFCDVTVIVEGQKFRAHRNILSASSTYFHQLFSVAGQVVELSFVRAEIFGKILDYIYSSRIMSVCSDVLDELIKSGQELGIKFIADLGIPAAKGKNVPSMVKDSASGTSASSPSQRDAETQETVIKPEGQEARGGMPVMTHSFSLQGIQFETTKITVSGSDGEDDDDLIFCSEIVPPKECAKDKKAASQNQPCSSPVGASDQKSCGSGGFPCLTNTTAAQSLILSASQLNSNQAQSGAESPVSATPQHFTGNIIGLNRSLLNSSLGASSLHQTHVTPAINLLEQNQQPSHNGSITGVEATPADDEEVVEDDVDIINSSSPGLVSSSSLVQQPSVSKAASTKGSGAQRKQFTFSQEPSSQPGELKIKISDVLSGNNKELSSGVASKDVAGGLKIRTFDTATEIGGLSTGCKVYANISEDTYDIMIPVEGDSEEGEAKPDYTPKKSGDESRKGKRRKVKHDDHYKLIENGRVYYICIVCQRPFLRLGSLWRHFNIHSWEKKFMCRYCDKVFPLAEYRTRHELLHTQERRYQCLVCGEFLLRYQNVASHIRSVHSQEPSGDTKLYQLHPHRSLQVRQDTYISDHPSSVPGANEGGIVCPVGSEKDGTEGTTSNSPAKQITWDDIFVLQGNETIFKQNQSEGMTEFEFMIPESH